MTKPRTEARIVATRINATLSRAQSDALPAAPGALQKIRENEALKKMNLPREPGVPVESSRRKGTRDFSRVYHPAQKVRGRYPGLDCTR